MGGGEGLSRCALAPVDAEASTSSSSAAGGRLVEDPILFLVLFHKAIKAELEELGRLAAAAAESGGDGEDLVADLRRRFEFLKQVYKYHCTAEDEVVFVALDAHVKNIACTYCLEHKSIDGLFESIFYSLNIVSKNRGTKSKELQELVFSVGALEKAICIHIQKEEEQVFPLLMKQFSGDEQALLVQQYICSVPIMLLVDLFPWLMCFLSLEEHKDLKLCLKKVLPNDTLLQELVVSWLDDKTTKPLGACIQYGEPESVKKTSEFLSHESFSLTDCLQASESSLYTSTQDGPIYGLHLWHAVIRNELKEIIDDLHELKAAGKPSTLDLVILRIKFLADVLMFYSNVLDKIFYPLLEELCETLPSYLPFFHKDEVEGVQEVLYHGNQPAAPFSTCLEKLMDKMEPFVIRINKQLSFQETEVFPLISNRYSYVRQQQLLFKSLHMMPLGLLKCVITWFSPHIPKDKLKCILRIIKESGFLDENLAFLLHEWVRTGYSGKTSVKDLLEMFKSSVPYSNKQSEGGMETCRRLDDATFGPGLVGKYGTGEFDSSISNLDTADKHAMLYSSEINLRLFFPHTSSLWHPALEFSPSIGLADSLEPEPIYHIYYFHKALTKEIEYLVQLSDRLPETYDLLFECRRRFHVMRVMYQHHVDAEDEIAFPALESNEKLKNMSSSYSIDHKLEAEYFKKISDMLSRMSDLFNLVTDISGGPSNLEFRRLSFRLRDHCRSLQKILGDHIRREEIELWAYFGEHFSIEDQRKIVGQMLGRTRAEILQEIILWLLGYLTPDEQHAMMSIWRKAAKDTMFDEWLTEWWEGMDNHNTSRVAKGSDNSSSQTMDVLKLVSKYLSCEDANDRGVINVCEENVTPLDLDCAKLSRDAEHLHEDKNCKEQRFDKLSSSYKKKTEKAVTDQVDKPVQALQSNKKLLKEEKLLTMSQQELEDTIIKVSRDTSLDSQSQTRVIQYLLSSGWNTIQQQSIREKTLLCGAGKLQGQFSSYRDKDESIFGCQHYKQNCKIIAPCCKQIFTCKRCHDDVSDHPIDRKAITQMMCMKCLVIQPIGTSCISCRNFSVAKYYCRICKLFDDEREIYHCPFCNLCRVGKGLGIDFFHCMKCNACMSRTLSGPSGHACREKWLEDMCPICHEDMFTSCNPVKALQCGHLMHSSCFQEYTCLHYTCPVCSRSLGDMTVYFAMLDTLLAEEKLPDEYEGRTQAILCNDCQRRGSAPFHWLHHKCAFCGSYNTRIL